MLPGSGDAATRAGVASILMFRKRRPHFRHIHLQVTSRCHQHKRGTEAWRQAVVSSAFVTRRLWPGHEDAGCMSPRRGSGSGENNNMNKRSQTSTRRHRSLDAARGQGLSSLSRRQISDTCPMRRVVKLGIAMRAAVSSARRGIGLLAHEDFMQCNPRLSQHFMLF